MWTRTSAFASRFVSLKPRFYTPCALRPNYLTIANGFSKNVSFSSRPITSMLGSSTCTCRSRTFIRILHTRLNGKGAEQNLLQNDSFMKSGEKGKENKSDEDKWYTGKNAWKVGLASLSIAGFIGAGGFLFVYGAPAKDSDGNCVMDEFSDLPNLLAYPKRALREIRFIKKMIQDPSSEKLLPEKLKEPYFQPPYTLVLEMTGVLVHPDWTLANGWRFKKRPGLDYFLQQVGHQYEVVIYTHEPGVIVNSVISNMDPNGFVMYRLYREATKYVNGAHVKDLSFLNRDLSKVIIIDCDPKAVSLQPENGILLQKWSGNDSDRKLVDLASFLGTIAYNNVDDVRPVLEYYAQFDDPIEAFKERQKLLQEETEQKNKQVNKVVTSSPWSLSNWHQKN